jgi:hypothetical protein
MTLAELQQWVCDRLSADAWLAARRLVFIPESRRDAAAEADRALRSLGIFGLVMTPAFVGREQEFGQTSGLATCVIQIPEIPSSNRAAAGYATSLDAASRVGIVATTWAGALFRELRLIDTEFKDAIVHAVTLDIPIALSTPTNA